MSDLIGDRQINVSIKNPQFTLKELEETDFSMKISDQSFENIQNGTHSLNISS